MVNGVKALRGFPSVEVCVGVWLMLLRSMCSGCQEALLLLRFDSGWGLAREQ